MGPPLGPPSGPPSGVSTKGRIDFCFINEQPGHARTRMRQLEQAKARAHTASVVWKRKKSKKQRSRAQPAQSDARTILLHTSSSQYPFSDYTCSTGLRVDPFFCNPYTQDEQVSEVLDWHRQTILSRLTIQWDIMSISAWAPNAEVSLVESAMFAHARLAVTALMFDRRALISARPSKMTLHHCGQAVSLLRERLTRNDLVIDPPLLCTMVYLAILEIMIGNLTAAKVHRHAIRSTLLLPSAMAHLEAENRWKSIVLQYDLMSAMFSGETPSPLHRDIPHKASWSPTLASHLMKLVDHLPQGFRNLVQQSDLSPHIIEILCRTILTHGPSHQELNSSLAYLADTRSSNNDFWEACPYLMTNSEFVNLDKVVLLTIMVRMSLPQDESAVVTPVLLIAARAELSRRILSFHPSTGAEKKATIWALVSAVEAWHVQDPALKLSDPRSLIAGFRDSYPEMMSVDLLLNIVGRFSWKKPAPRLLEVCEALAGIVHRREGGDEQAWPSWAHAYFPFSDGVEANGCTDGGSR